MQHYLSTHSFAFTKSWHSFHHATSHFSISLQTRWPTILSHLLLVFEMHMHIFRKSGYLSITNLQPCVYETKNTEKKLENSIKRKRAYQKWFKKSQCSSKSLLTSLYLHWSKGRKVGKLFSFFFLFIYLSYVISSYYVNLTISFLVLFIFL